MTSIDREYYAQRAAAERKIASESAEPKIAALHSELADLYERLLSVPQKPEVRIVTDQGKLQSG